MMTGRMYRNSIPTPVLTGSGSAGCYGVDIRRTLSLVGTPLSHHIVAALRQCVSSLRPAMLRCKWQAAISLDAAIIQCVAGPHSILPSAAASGDVASALNIEHRCSDFSPAPSALTVHPIWNIVRISPLHVASAVG